LLPGKNQAVPRAGARFMFIDARTLPEGAAVEADIAIIGAGAAGITIAREFAYGTARIALFESGGLDYEEATQRLNAGASVGQAYAPLGMDRLRYFGGTTNHWSGGCRPFDASDLEGWPFGPAALVDYYRRAQPICQVGPFDAAPQYWGSGAAMPLSLPDGSPLQTGVIQYSPPTRFGTVYRAVLEKAANVAVHLHANLVDIETDDEAGAVTGLALACLGGNRFRAHARHYVLAAGGIENARLLLNANKGQQPAGLGNENDLVGRYFMDHADVPDTTTIVFADPHPPVGFYDVRTVRGQNVAGYLTIAASVREKAGLPALCFGILPGAPTDSDLATESVRQIFASLRAGRMPDHLGFAVARVVRGIEGRIGDLEQWLLHRSPAYYSTYYTCGSPPDRDSRVTLDTEIDPLGLRRARLDWRLPGDFPETVRRAHAILAQGLGAAGLGRVRLNGPQTGDDPLRGLQNAHHEMGTTRMHPDPRQGVVDADCRVHGLANLYVAGSSVYPTYGPDNPTFTIVALALRLADHLKARQST
jgi:choline dehydrogenase-like flavoprotein